MTERTSGALGRKPQLEGNDKFSIQWVETYTGLAPDPSYPIDVSRGITEWLMLGNGPDPTLTGPLAGYANTGVGNCVPCTHFHDIMIALVAGHLTEAAPTADECVNLYLTYDNGQDEGVVIAQFLLWLYKNGYIKAFAPVPLNRVDSVMAQFGRGVILGVDLTTDAQQLFNEGEPWTTANGETPNNQLGHGILKVASTGPLTSTSEMGAVVTWGAIQKATNPWFSACTTEAWIILHEEDQQSVAADEWAALLADLDALTGEQGGSPAPAPAPPAPPTPEPSPPAPDPDPPQPEPQPVPDNPPAPPEPPATLPPEFLEWWEEAKAWILAHF
jgi:hypothetical protein